MMELFPVLELGWLNGWIMFALFLIVEGASLLALNRDVAKRLFEFDRSTWSGRQRASFAMGKLLALICIILFFLTPLKTGSTVFYLGTTTFVLGLFGLVVALHNFNNSPLDRPCRHRSLQVLPPPPTCRTVLRDPRHLHRHRLLDSCSRADRGFQIPARRGHSGGERVP
jgi:hypothetical protein